MGVVRNSDRSLDAAIPDQRILRYVLLIGLLSGALYIAVYLAQCAFFHNGLVLVDVNPVPPTTPLDRGQLRWQASLYYGATGILFGLYGWLLYLCRHGHLKTATVRTYALLFPVLF